MSICSPKWTAVARKVGLSSAASFRMTGLGRATLAVVGGGGVREIGVHQAERLPYGHQRRWDGSLLLLSHGSACKMNEWKGLGDCKELIRSAWRRVRLNVEWVMDHGEGSLRREEYCAARGARHRPRAQRQIISAKPAPRTERNHTSRARASKNHALDSSRAPPFPAQ